jgi:hypothetical protein
MSRFVPLSVAGLLIGAGIPVSQTAVAQEPGMFTSCEHRFAVIFPGAVQPMTRDITFTTQTGAMVPARQYYHERGMDRFTVTVAVFPGSAAQVDDAVVEHAAEQIRKKGGTIRFQYTAPYDPGMPGRQLNISHPGGKQLRASVYMADRRLTITEAMASEGDFNALQFEQSITLIDANGDDLDRPNNGEVRNFGCRR